MASSWTTACGGSDTSGGAGGSAGTTTSATSATSASATTSGAGGGACGTAVNQGSPVPETAGLGAFPTPAGGTIADGTYVLTKFEIYPPGSIDPYMRTQTLVIAGDHLEIANKKDSEPEEHGGGTVSISGTTITLSLMCPKTGQLSNGFTATATEIQLFEMDGMGTNEVHTFTKK